MTVKRMAPKPPISKKKTNTVPPTFRKSQRAAVNILSEENRHRRTEESPTQRHTDNMNPNSGNYGIFSLNDDCLLAILSFLSIEGLFAMKLCCRRFSALADVTAPKQCRSQNFQYNHKSERHRNILECYGEFMQDVTFERKRHDEHPSNSEWKWVRRCTALKTLTIRNMASFYDNASARIYEGLQSLGLEDCYDRGAAYDRIIEACTNLKSIKLRHSTFTDSTLHCIARLKHIESIVLINNCCWWSFSARHVTALQGLNRLKHLGIDFRGCEDLISVTTSVNKLASLVRFDLYFASNPENFVDAVNQLENINVCHMYFCLNRNTPFDGNVFANSIPHFHVCINRKCNSYLHHYDVDLRRKY